MDPYIKEYNCETIETEGIDNISEFNALQLKKHINILNTNIRSISKNYDELCTFLCQFKCEFDIIVLTETFVLHDLQLFNIDGYEILYNESTLNKNDGVIVYIKECLEYTYDLVNIGDTRAIQIDVTYNQHLRAKITAIYRSPNSCLNTFNVHLLEYLETVSKVNMHIITGDLNVDILKKNTHEEEYKNVMNSCGYVSYINKYTRFLSKSCLDHFFIKSLNNNYHVKSYIFRYEITDHSPTAISIKVAETDKNYSKNKSILQKRYINYNKLRLDLKKERWNGLYEETNVNEIANTFINTLISHINNNTTIKNIKKCEIRRKPWITPALIKSINNKNDKYRLHQEHPDDIFLEQQYKIYKNNLTKLLTKVKKDYFKTEVDKNSGSSKLLWECVRKISGKKKSETKIDKIKTENEELIMGTYNIANAFNKHYSELGEKYANQIPDIEYNKVNNPLIENTLYLFKTSEKEVHDMIKQLKPKKSAGNDNICSETLQQIYDEIVTPLSYLINKCFSTGRFPDVFKVGIIKPLYKGGDKLKIINYRPISLISNVAKILEKIIRNRITHFLDKYKLLSEHQYGFRKGRSTEDAIYELTKQIYNALDKKKPALCIFIDLSKAFDTVNHTRLLEKFNNYGLRGKVYDLIKSYLSDRIQYVSVNDTLSDPETVSYGVPQGTVLGPLLFTIYINDLLTMRTSGAIVSFADDTAVWYESDSWKTLKSETENDFKNIKNWFQHNKLTLNIEKTKYLPFTSYSANLPHMGSLNIGSDAQIPEAKSVKYLGIIIDRHAKWDLQIENVVKKVRGLLPRLKYLREFLDIHNLKTLYYALIQSQLTYGIIGWGGALDIHQKKLDVIQKWAIKIIYRRKITYPTDLLFEESGLFDVRQLYFFKICLNLHKQKISIESKEHFYQTRNKDIYVTMRAEKSIGQRHSYYIATRIYNLLPGYIRDISGYNLFKLKTKRWIIETGRDIIKDMVKWNR